MQVPDFVLARLPEWGVHGVCGYPGDGINGLLGGFGRADGDPEFIQPRHEEMGAFMVCAHAKFTGEVGCCMATSGPGAIHLLNGRYDAKHGAVYSSVGWSQPRVLPNEGELRKAAGLAGSWGVESGKYQISMDCGEQALLPVLAGSAAAAAWARQAGQAGGGRG